MEIILPETISSSNNTNYVLKYINIYNILFCLFNKSDLFSPWYFNIYYFIYKF